MNNIRNLTEAETRIVSALVERAAPSYRPLLSHLDSALVHELSDGGMGGLRFVGRKLARMGKQVSEMRFRDTDGVVVSAALNVDESGDLFELDIFKSDFSPLRAFPGHDSSSASEE